ncbi:amino acid adenylation domain-containing protein [Sinomicrobium weinanense]|uniref:Amino acid adenylation domain-containing protein n=1 Tax=Sinomicrobium weinanense TaxID=2842200 RepID=A0A926Q207_9FLAO|nr:amino acid adenylation domain-containing protein [Sinomicrobium weinanense]MBC9794426.1 amino acid adenylation domain-containing protein [Sinomicrobium weinanense]MBU3124333.1 amino acid adenylation domain-containing protein [Sinomicrobium weinanense]
MEKKCNENTGSSDRQNTQTQMRTEGLPSEQQHYTPTETICGLIAQKAQVHPERAAIIDGKITINFRHLMDRANAVAGELVTRGVPQGSLVGVCMSRSWELVATLLGVLRAGCAYVPLDPAYPQERVRYMLEHSRAIAAIVDDENCAELCKGVRELIWLNKVKQQTADKLAGPSANDLAYVIYTSGSTGLPKGVAIEHRNVVAMTQAMSHLLDDKDLEGMLAATSVCFDPSVMEILGTLSLGGTVILAKNMLDLPTLSSANLVKSCVVVPSAIQALLSSGWVPHGIRCIVFGSEALKQPLVEKLFALETGTRVVNAYGPTEDTVFSTAVEIFNDTQNITIGKSVANSRSYILDDDMNPVSDGIEGELFLAGNKLARGYLYDEVRTTERFIKMKPTSAIPEVRLYRTGDLCRRNENGEIEFLGRVDQQVKVRGFRIELEEIEAALESMPGITTAAAAAVDGGIGQKMLVAYVVSPHESVTGENAKAYLAQRLPKYMVPQVVIPLKELPLLPNGKLDRNKLKYLKGPGQSEQEQQATDVNPGPELHTNGQAQNLEGHGTGRPAAILSVIQKEVFALLNLNDSIQILPDDSFDSLGLDSLSSLELSVRLSKIFGLRLSGTVAMEYSSPIALTHHILELTDSGTGNAPGGHTCTVASDTLRTFQERIRSSHPTFQAAKASSWSADDKSKLVQEVLRMVNSLDRNPYSKVLRTGSATKGTVTDAYHDEEQEAIIWTTNLYLGLNRDKEVIEEASKALQQFGSGMGTSAAASGMTDLHLQFEKEFAELVGKPGACLFPTGYTANVGAVAGLLGKNDVVVIDQLCHASIVDGARLCGARIRTFQHNSSSDLEAVLESEVSPYRTVLVVLEGVYSMGEGAAPVAEIVRTAKAYDALVLVDEAHSFGFYGERGAGICAAQGITEEVDFLMTTLSKALGSLGGVVAAREEHIDLLKSSSRAYIFQASVSPADMAAALTALRRLRSDDKLRERLWDTTRYMRRRFIEAGYDLGTGDGPIITPHFSDKDKLYAIVQGMYKRGVQTSAVTYPIVESGRGRLRLICSSAHTQEDVDRTLDALIAAEREVDGGEHLAGSQTDDSRELAIMQSNMEKWMNDFTDYLKGPIAEKAPHQTPNLVVAIRIPDREKPMTIVINERDVTPGTEEIPDLPMCTLFLKNNRAASALLTSNVQELLHCISKGTCVLNGQVEPFIWLIARIVEKQQAVVEKCS